jgi:hypothetical protein
MGNKKKIEGSNGLEDTELLKEQKNAIAEAEVKAKADAKAAIDEAQVAEDEAQRAKDKADAMAKAEADAEAEVKAKEEAEAEAIIDAQTKAVLDEESKSITSFAITDNLKILTTDRHDYPDKNQHQSKSTVNLDSFTGVIEKGQCLRIDKLMETSNILDIQLWFLSKEAPKFTVGNMSDFACYMDCSDGRWKATLQENGKFNAIFARVKPNDRDIIIKFNSNFAGKIKTLVTYNV